KRVTGAGVGDGAGATVGSGGHALGCVIGAPAAIGAQAHVEVFGVGRGADVDGVDFHFAAVGVEHGSGCHLGQGGAAAAGDAVFDGAEASFAGRPGAASRVVASVIGGPPQLHIQSGGVVHEAVVG